MVLTTSSAPRTASQPHPWLRRLLVTVLLSVLLAARAAIPTDSPADLASAPASAAPSTACLVGGALGFAAGPLGAVAGCKVGERARGAVTDAAGNGFKSVAKSFAQAWVSVIQMSLAWFVKIPTPQYARDSVIQRIQQATVTLQIYGLVLSILIGSFRLIMARRNATMGVAQESFMALAKTVFGAWMLGGVLTVATVGSDALAEWLLAQGIAGSPNLMRNLANAQLVTLGSGLVFVFALVGILGGILQAVLLIGRQAMLAVVIATAPIVGAFGGTQTGRQAFSKMMNWVVALLLWKPVAALVYWVAFAMAGHDVRNSQDLQMVLYGMILLSLAALVLPILVKLVSGGAAMASGSGLQAGIMTAGVVTAAGTLAAGAATGGAGAAAGGAGAGSSTAGMAGASGGPAGFSGASSAAGAGSGGPNTGGGTGGGPSGTRGAGSSSGSGTGTGSGVGQSSAGATQAGAWSSPDSSRSGGTGADLGDFAFAAQSMSSSAEAFFDDDSSFGAAAGDSGDVR